MPLCNYLLGEWEGKTNHHEAQHTFLTPLAVSPLCPIPTWSSAADLLIIPKAIGSLRVTPDLSCLLNLCFIFKAHLKCQTLREASWTSRNIYLFSISGVVRITLYGYIIVGFFVHYKSIIYTSVNVHWILSSLRLNGPLYVCGWMHELIY